MCFTFIFDTIEKKKKYLKLMLTEILVSKNHGGYLFSIIIYWKKKLSQFYNEHQLGIWNC